MSIASTQQAMRFVGFTDSQDNCSACAHASEHIEHGRSDGLRCRLGGFFVIRQATCKHWEREERIQIGPTDI